MSLNAFCVLFDFLDSVFWCACSVLLPKSSLCILTESFVRFMYCKCFLLLLIESFDEDGVNFNEAQLMFSFILYTFPVLC